MKRVLITGADSYIGTSVEKWLMQSTEDYHVDTLDMRDPAWESFDFSPYDSVFHVAAIVHKNEKNVDPSLYDKVNRDLPFNLAKKLKAAGVSQFIFLSTMSVYGSNEIHITIDTPEKPATLYGKSKLEAEELLKTLVDDRFKVLILRPPMVYGPKATGNYSRLSKLAKVTPVFPNISNQRSMIFIDNLSEFVKKSIDLGVSGTFFPQNKDYVCTSELVKVIRQVNDKKVKLVSLFNPIIKQMSFLTQISKMFGNLVYDQKMSETGFNYQVVDFEDSIKKSEEK